MGKTQFLLFGGRGAGKDTVTNMLIEKIFGAEQLRIAQFVVQACHALGIQNPTRDDLAFVGHDIGRKMFGDDVWLKQAVSYAEFCKTYKTLIVSDCRYPNEFDAFVKLDFVPILIDCKEATRIERVKIRDGGYINLEQLKHPSENYYKSFPYALKLDNNGSIIELEEQVDRIISILMKE